MLLLDFKGYIARQASSTSTTTAAPERRSLSILSSRETCFMGRARDG